MARGCPAKISDVTGGGLYLFVTPDENRPGNTASNLWQMGYRFHGRQKTYSIGPYANGRDGTFSLADARCERDKAKDLLKEGKDPSTEKQLDKHRQAAARPFEQRADEWLAKKRVEKVKRGRIVAVRDPKTIEVLELRVGYVEDRFGKLCRQDIKRPDVLAFMRSYEAKGKLETRDRVRSIGEQICNYANVEDDGYNPFRNLNGQMIANNSTQRPGVTEPRDVTRVFKLVTAPWTRARFESELCSAQERMCAHRTHVPNDATVKRGERFAVGPDSDQGPVPPQRWRLTGAAPRRGASCAAVFSEGHFQPLENIMPRKSSLYTDAEIALAKRLFAQAQASGILKPRAVSSRSH
ncbi:Arm DNA-binding domain-containing protein [Bradyrhizobium sp. LjRoot220]|uniref:tyrosine-type recombinase/integrase n=1 Tax=Bradyrhizobium sp. LjRoot220 TaxID=3342284 RepID=UPI003ED06A33